MSRPTSGVTRQAAVTACKFFGATSLGLLTGASLSNALFTAPSLRWAPTPAAAQRVLYHLQHGSSSIQQRLASSAAAALVAALLLSPRGWRHPYLAWAAAAAVLTQWTVPAKVEDPDAPWLTPPRLRTSDEPAGQPPRADDAIWDEIDAAEAGVGAAGVEDGVWINGEAVWTRITKWRAAAAWRAAGFGVAWGVAALGLWGDGFAR